MINHTKLSIKDLLLIIFAYIFIAGQLVFYSFNHTPPPDLYFFLTAWIIIILNKVVPKNKYANIVRYIANFIYLLYGLSIIIR